MAARKKATRRGKVAAGRRGLTPAEVIGEPAPPEVDALVRDVEQADGVVLARYRDPLGGRWLVVAALPVSRVAPTPFQRDLSDAHVKRLGDVIDRLGTFLDPVIAVPAPDTGGDVRFWTPNGLHRLSALGRMGAKTVTVLLSPDPALAYRILALNTEKAHNTKERALEAIRMARGLTEADPERRESDYALELEDGSLLTLGVAYETRPRFAGGAYAPALKQSDALLEEKLPQAIAIRERRAEQLLEIDDRVAEIAKELKAKGFESPYLRNFIVARIRPFRPRGKPAPGPDELFEHMATKADGFDVGKVRGDQLAKTAGAAGPADD